MDLPATVQIKDEIRKFSLEAAVLSSSPVLPGYTVAAIGKDGSFIAVRRDGVEHWQDVPCRTVTASDDILVDLIHHKSEFWLLTAQERIGKLVQDQDPNGNLRTSWIEMNTRERASYLSDTEAAEKLNVKIKRYLVEAKGDLYMVLKLLSEAGGVIEIKVFKLNLNDADEDKDEHGSSSDSSDLQCDRFFFTWEDVLNQLPDRNFFIGQASSRSFATNSTPRLYFLDDACTKDPAKPGFFIREEMGFIPLTEDMGYEVPETWPVLGRPWPDRSSDRVPPSWWIH